MLLYLLRHADALDGENDDARPLSPKGHRQVEALGRFLSRSEAFSPAQAWHSPLIRARESAAGLIAAARRRCPLIETEGLRPEDDPAAFGRRVASATGSVVLVGHEPHLGALASALVTGHTSPVVFAFDKCTLLALEGQGARWVVRWQLAPQLFP